MTSWYFVLDPSTVVKVQELPPEMKDFERDGLYCEKEHNAYIAAWFKYREHARSLPPLTYIEEEPLTKQVYELGEFRDPWNEFKDDNGDWQKILNGTRQEAEEIGGFETRQVVTLK